MYNFLTVGKPAPFYKRDFETLTKVGFFCHLPAITSLLTREGVGPFLYVVLKKKNVGFSPLILVFGKEIWTRQFAIQMNLI